MKKILILAVIAAAFTGSASTASAGSHRYSPAPAYSCTPVYCSTKEVCRRTECRWATDHCGRRVRVEVIVITYADLYSDGSRLTYTRTYRA